MVLYSQYKDDKGHGITCLFKDGIPLTGFEERKADSVEGETVVAGRKEASCVVIEQRSTTRQSAGDVGGGRLGRGPHPAHLCGFEYQCHKF